MNREQIIQMAREAGFVDYELDDGTDEAFDIRYVRFAKLVEQHVLTEWAKEFAGLGEWACVHRIENELKEK